MKASRFSLLYCVGIVVSCWAFGGLPVQAQFGIGSSSYNNRLFVPTPDPVALGATNAQPTSIAIFGGNVGAFGHPQTPMGGGMTLVRSGFGQPVQTHPLLEPAAAIGEELTPVQPNLVGVKPDSISPPEKVFWLASQKKLIATEAGLVTIRWGATVRQYLISDVPSQTPMGMYWTQTATGEPGGPPVEIAPNIGIQFLWNSLVPSGTLYVRDNRIYATNTGSGFVVLIYTNKVNGSYVGRELVDVRDSDPALSASLTHSIGSFLEPSLTVTNPGPVTCRRGLGEYVHQLNLADPAFNSRSFAYRETTAPGQINVFWTRAGVAGMFWPYEMDSYHAQWPPTSDPQFRRLYLTEDGNGTPTTSPPVDLSAIPRVQIHYNDDIPAGLNQAGVSTNLTLQFKRLHASRTGRILLHYEGNQGATTNGFLGFQLVEVVPNDPDFSTPDAVIGTALSPEITPDPTPLPGIVTKGDRTPAPGPDFFVYVHAVDGPMKNLIYPVRPAVPSDIEVFWMRQGVQGVAWPYEMHNYGAIWSPTPQRFVRGHTADALGAPVDLPESLNAEIKYQEPKMASLNGPVDGRKILQASQAGYILLKYSLGSPVGSSILFRTVQSVIHTGLDPSVASALIGEEITDSYHQSSDQPFASKPGYVHIASDQAPLEDRFAHHIYTNSGQIFPVNQGKLEVWWMNLDTEGVQWPSLVRRYDALWPGGSQAIVIASEQGTGLIDPEEYPDFELYFQNDPEKPGFNPNDEHALVLQRPEGGGRGIFALRSDLGSPATSLPFVLMSYRLPGEPPGDRSRRGFRVWNVEAEEGAHRFQYAGEAGTQLRPPFPLSFVISGCDQTGVSGPYWKDRAGTFWAKAAGDDGGEARIVMQWFYRPHPSFFVPEFYRPEVPGSQSGCLPWLDLLGPTPNVPVNVAYQIRWPADIAQLHIGETLIDAKRGLPDIGSQCSVEVVYQQSLAQGGGPSAELIDPTRERRVSLAALPADVPVDNIEGKVFFKELPPPLRSRLYYDPTGSSLVFRGIQVESVTGVSLLPNIITHREASILTDPKFLGVNPAFAQAVNELIVISAAPLLADPNDPTVDTLALTAGVASGTGFVTLAMGTSTNRCSAEQIITLQILRVVCPLYSGNLQAIANSSPFDEKLSLRFDGDMGGHSDNYVFEWRYVPDQDGLQPTLPASSTDPSWLHLTAVPENGVGAVDVTIGGAGLLTLSDNWVTCRYRSVDSANPCGNEEWSDWAPPQLQEGWIKRVVRGINPFEQRFQDLGNPTRVVNTTISMIAQAGKRWQGATPLDPAKIDRYGLIEVYETVLKEAIKLSVEGTPPLDYPPANNQLLLVAGRLSDLYTLLGNEAFAEAADPTISVGASPDLAYVAAAPSIHAFMNQVPDLLEEELGLLRGRDSSKAPGVESAPVYNRFYWNFTGDFGQTAYVLKHQILDELGDRDGGVDVEDAAIIYPQGHGDAWGHYLTATKYFYRLFRNPTFSWTPRSEATLVGGVPVTVNYVNERKFAQAAAAKARTGVEIVNLTYRQHYDEDPAKQWQGYRDTVTNAKSSKVSQAEPRAWGLSEWGSRAGQAALFDWVVGNALLPDVDQQPHSFPIQKVDRTTVLELSALAASLDTMQSEVDKADTGLNPLGLAKNVMPFDIDSSQIGEAGGKTHFEQVYDRGVRMLNNALTVFNYANNATQQLRRQADDASTFNRIATERSADFKNRLIEIFGTPYPEDMGNGGQTYPAGYDGPDTKHYDYVDPWALLGLPPGKSESFTSTFQTKTVLSNGGVKTESTTLSYNLAQERYGLVKPASWTGQRAASGEIQLARSDLLQARFRFMAALANFNNLTAQIDQESENLRAQYNLHANEISIRNRTLNTQVQLDVAIVFARTLELGFRSIARTIDTGAAAIAEAMPKSLIVGTADGGDLTSSIRGEILNLGSSASGALLMGADVTDVVGLIAQQTKEQIGIQSDIELTILRNNFDDLTALGRLQELVRQQVPQRLELQALQEALQQTLARYSSALARGFRLLQDFQRFQQETAAEVQTARYKDMAFRIFRNDALQKYQAQFDLAAAYVYMVARAYDFETNFDPYDSRSPRQLLNQIVRSRAIGLIQDGQPQTGGATGDPGLTDAMARLIGNWAVLEGRFGFNNPQREEMQFSLRREFFRIPGSGPTNDALWRTVLERSVVTNLYALPEFRRFARFVSTEVIEPGLVIPFSTSVELGLNFFGRPLGGGDHAYDSSHFATKIRSVGVWFNNYSKAALADTPRVLLLPMGADVMRSPLAHNFSMRQWTVLEQAIPIPFPLGGSALRDSDWTPFGRDSLDGSFADIRQHAPFRAYHDDGYNRSQVTYDSRLIGRSVWNTRWLLVIPAGYMSNDRNEALQRFINGTLVNGVRDGNGIKDISLLFQTYSYQGQ